MQWEAPTHKKKTLILIPILCSAMCIYAIALSQNDIRNENGARWPGIAHLITRQVTSGLSVQEKKFNIDFQHGGHLGSPIRMI